jgi:hypothetical protein
MLAQVCDADRFIDGIIGVQPEHVAPAATKFASAIGAVAPFAEFTGADIPVTCKIGGIRCQSVPLQRLGIVKGGSIALTLAIRSSCRS